MIILDNVTKEYKQGHPALDRVSLHVHKGEFVFVVGKSGSGKTTLMRLLLKEIEPTSGRIIVNGYDYAKIKSRKIPYLRRQIGFVFQDFRLLQDRNIYDNVAFAQKVVEAPNRHMKRQVLNVLDLVGLADRLKAFPGDFPEESSRGLQSQGRWSTILFCCLRTSQPAIWIRLQPERSWISLIRFRKEERQL